MIINTIEDLDSLEKDKREIFMSYLKSSMTRTIDAAEYPLDYSTETYVGEAIEPVLVEITDLSIIEKFGFTAKDFA